MKKPTKKDKRTNLEKEIENLIEILNKTQPASDEYTTISANLKVLYEAQATIKSRKFNFEILIPIITAGIGVAGNLAGLYSIMNFEKTDIITTKALGFVMRNKV